jgi:hypothetical protein
MQSFNLANTVDFPTRICNFTGTANENIFIYFTLINSFVISPIVNGLSNHDAQLLILNNVLTKEKSSSLVYKTHLVDEVSTSTFLQSLNNETWEHIYEQEDINKTFSLLLSTF